MQDFLLQVILLLSAFLILFREIRSMSAERTQYFYHCKHWIELIFALLSMTTASLQFCFQSHARSCFYEVSYKSYNFRVHSYMHVLYRFTVNLKKYMQRDISLRADFTIC